MITTDNRPAQLPQLSDNLSELSSDVLTASLETILWFHSTYADRIVAELGDRASSGETRIYCDEFDNMPISLWVRIEKYLR